MKKIIIYLMVVVIMATMGNAFSFDILGYRFSYTPHPDVQVINNVVPIQQQQQVSQIANIVDEQQYAPIVQIHDYDNEIREANKIKEMQLALKELDYRRIGFIDEDMQQEYTIYVSQEGLIQAIAKGNDNPEAVLKGSLSQIRRDIEQQNYYALKDDVKIPFKVKMKIFWRMF